jgi:ABC-type nitrate/sulfonate/bicarbonate transport system substrate-binding protein
MRQFLRVSLLMASPLDFGSRPIGKSFLYSLFLKAKVFDEALLCQHKETCESTYKSYRHFESIPYIDGKLLGLLKPPQMPFKKSPRLFVLIVAALLLVLHGGSAISQERKVNIAYAGPSLIALPFLAAQEWKLFSQNGLSTQLIVMTFTISIPAVSAEQVDYLGGVGPATVSATLRGIPARAVWFSSDKVLWSLMAQPQTKTLTDLRQKPIGITGGLGATGHVALLLALEKAGQDSKTFAISPFTGVSDMIQALESGYLSAAMLQPPQLFYSMSKGFKAMLNVASMIEMPVGGLTTLVKTIHNRPQEVRAVIKSVQQAKQRMLQSKEETIGLIMKVGKTDREAALKTYDMLQDALAGDGRPTRAGIENILKALVLQGRLPNANVPFEEIADSRIATEVARELGYRVQ